MINTLKTEIYKFKSKRGTLIFFISLVIFSMVFSALFNQYLVDTKVDGTANMWTKVGNIGLYSTYFLIAVIVLANIVVSSDYIKGTISTQIISGSNKINIYISKIIVLIFVVVISLLISFVAIIGTMGVAYGFGEWNAETYKNMAAVFGRMIIYVLPFITLYSLFGLIIKNEVATAVVSFFTITFLGLIAAFLIKVFKINEKFMEYMWFNFFHLDFMYKESFWGWVVCSIIAFIVFLIIGTYIAKNRDYN